MESRPYHDEQAKSLVAAAEQSCARPRYPGVYDTWRFRYACEPEWFVIEGWPTQASCEAGRARFLAVNPGEPVTPCAYYASGNTESLEGYR